MFFGSDMFWWITMFNLGTSSVKASNFLPTLLVKASHFRGKTLWVTPLSYLLMSESQWFRAPFSLNSRFLASVFCCWPQWDTENRLCFRCGHKSRSAPLHTTVFTHQVVSREVKPLHSLKMPCIRRIKNTEVTFRMWEGAGNFNIAFLFSELDLLALKIRH